jgi:small-conductance mechanosensitive channel
MRQPPSIPHFLRNLIVFALLLLLFGWAFGLTIPGLAQETPPTPSSEEPMPTALPGAPVEVNGSVVFYLTERVGSFTPLERAALVTDRLNNVATNPFLPFDGLTLVETDTGTDIMSGEQILLTVTEADARSLEMARQELAEKWAGTLQAVIESTRSQFSVEARLTGYLQALAVILFLVILIWLVNRLYRRLVRRIDELPTETLARKGFKRTTLYRSGRWKRTARLALNLARILVDLLLVLALLPLLFSFFPRTARLTEQTLGLITQPLAALWNWFNLHRSDFFTIAIIVFVTFLLIRAVNWFFQELEQGAIRIAGFEPEWSRFTSRLIGFLLIVLAVVVAFPYIPGSDSDAFRGITIFLGALFTLSSTVAVSNVIAGVIQTYTGAFRVGDVIKIGDVSGIVVEKRLLSTEVRTFKNEEVFIPNASVISSNVLNYSKMARGKGVVFYTTVTIGYDAPWRKIHELLIAAAKDTPDIIDDPSPFVLQTSLNDYHVSYQLNCYTRRPDRMFRIYSALHATIQDKFNEAGVEIMSPAFTALRDGNTVTIPEGQRPEGYQPPGFRIDK